MVTGSRVLWGVYPGWEGGKVHSLPAPACSHTPRSHTLSNASNLIKYSIPLSPAKRSSRRRDDSRDGDGHTHTGREMASGMPKNRFLERLERGETIVCAEGYVFELERRGYLQAGPFVPLVVLEHPEVVRQLHLDFVRAGSGTAPPLDLRRLCASLVPSP